MEEENQIIFCRRCFDPLYQRQDSNLQRPCRKFRLLIGTRVQKIYGIIHLVCCSHQSAICGTLQRAVQIKLRTLTRKGSKLCIEAALRRTSYLQRRHVLMLYILGRLKRLEGSFGACVEQENQIIFCRRCFDPQYQTKNWNLRRLHQSNIDTRFWSLACQSSELHLNRTLKCAEYCVLMAATNEVDNTVDFKKPSPNQQTELAARPRKRGWQGLVTSSGLMCSCCTF